MDVIARRPAVAMRSALALVSVAFIAGGCMNLDPQRVSGMSSYQICELDTVQRANLTPAARQQLASELARRQEDCRAHQPAIQAYIDWDLNERTYFNQSP
jgi:hypothetical protein